MKNIKLESGGLVFSRDILLNHDVGLFITGDVQKPKKNFLQENVRRLKEMKLEKTNKMNTQRNKTLQVRYKVLVLVPRWWGCWFIYTGRI